MNELQYTCIGIILEGQCSIPYKTLVFCRCNLGENACVNIWSKTIRTMERHRQLSHIQAGMLERYFASSVNRIFGVGSLREQRSAPHPLCYGSLFSKVRKINRAQITT